MASVHRSIFLTAVGRYGEFLLFLMGTMILSRILTPRDVGIFAAANSVVAFAQTIRNFGTNDYLIQKEQLELDDLRRALAVAVLLSWLIALILAACAGLIADNFDEPQLKPIILMIAASFLFLPLISTAQARLSREMKFGIIAIVGLVGSGVNLITAITLSLQGYGALSIAWATLIGNVGALVAMIALAPQHMVWRAQFTELKAVLSFGSWVTGSSIVRNLGYNGYMLVVARIVGFEALGLYMRAATVVERFVTILLDIIKAVALPSFAAMRRNGQPAGPAILRSLSLMAAVLWPVYAFIGLHASDVILVLYGGQWLEATPVVQVLAISIIVSLNLPALMPTALTAYGQVKTLFVFNVIIYISRLVAVFAVAHYGLVAVALAVTASSLVAVPPYVWVMQRRFDVPVLAFAMSQLRALVLTLLPQLPAYWIAAQCHGLGWPPLFVLMAAGSVMALCWLVMAGPLVPAVAEERRKLIAVLKKRLTRREAL